MKHTIVVTGASGFLGRHVCRVLTARGHSVVGLGHHPLASYAGLACTVADWIVWDMSHQDVPRLPSGVKVIAHLAQSARFRDFADGAADMFNVNLRSTFELLEAARKGGAPRFVYVSTGGVYGEGRSAPPEAPVLANPHLGFYPMTKLASELLVNSYEKLFPVAILRPFFPFGPGQQPDRLMPRLIETVIARQRLMLQGEGGLTINPIFVADAAEVVARAVEDKGDLTVDVAGRELVSLRRLGELIGAAVGQEPLFDVDTAQTAVTLVGDCDGMIRRLGYTPAIGLADAIAQTAAAILQRKPT